MELCDENADQFSEKDSTEVFDEEDAEEESPHKFDASSRRFRLFQFLCTEKRSREDIFDYLGDYYGVDESNQKYLGRPSQRAGKKLKQDLFFLKRVGYTVKQIERDSTTCYHIESDGFSMFPRFGFSSQEIEALALLQTLFDDPAKYLPANSAIPFPPQPPQIPFAGRILSLIGRLVATLSPRQAQEFKSRTQKPFVFLNLGVVTDYLPHQETIEKISQAMLLHQRISFDYQSASRQSGVTTHQAVDPYYIYRQDEHLYLFCYSDDPYSSWKNKEFNLRLDRIVVASIKPLAEPIHPPRRQKPIEFHYWIEASASSSKPSQRWLWQDIERTEDLPGSNGRQKRYLIRAQEYNKFRIIQQLQKYGSKVELVDPPELREIMKLESERLHHLYHS